MFKANDFYGKRSVTETDDASWPSFPSRSLQGLHESWPPFLLAQSLQELLKTLGVMVKVVRDDGLFKDGEEILFSPDHRTLYVSHRCEYSIRARNFADVIAQIHSTETGAVQRTTETLSLLLRLTVLTTLWTTNPMVRSGSTNLELGSHRRHSSSKGSSDV